MSLNVETGTAASNSDSYISLSDADAYFVARGAPTSWTGTDAVKEGALRIALTMVDSNNFIGQIVDNDQALNWPRYNAIDKQGRERLSTTIPRELKDAQCEYALAHLRDGDFGTQQVANTKKIKMDVMEKETFNKPSRKREYEYIDNLLSPLIRGSSNQGTVYRG